MNVAKKLLKLRKLVKAFKAETKDVLFAAHIEGYLDDAYDAQDCYEVPIGLAKERIIQRIEILSKDAEENGEKFSLEEKYMDLLEAFENV